MQEKQQKETQLLHGSSRAVRGHVSPPLLALFKGGKKTLNPAASDGRDICMAIISLSRSCGEEREEGFQ